MSEERTIPRVVVVGLASCFGCQINITNAEAYLMDVLGQIDMRYWQLTSSDPMPDDFDIAIIEGAATTEDAREVLKRVREKAASVITIGACAATAGIPGMASHEYEPRQHDVYGAHVPAIVENNACAPCAVRDVIDVDYEVPCCPVDVFNFVRVLQKALYGSNPYERTSTMCGECKRNERGCFYGRGIMCLGMVTKQGCGARCPNLGRPCNGCAGISADANVDAARRIVRMNGLSVERFDKALEMFNQTSIKGA